MYGLKEYANINVENKYSGITFDKNKTTFNKANEKMPIQIVYSQKDDYFTTNYGQSFTAKSELIRKQINSKLHLKKTKQELTKVKEELRRFNMIVSSINKTILFKRKILFKLLNSQKNFLNAVLKEGEINLKALLKLNLQFKSTIAKEMNIHNSFAYLLSNELYLKLGKVNIELDVLGHRKMSQIIRDELIKKIIENQQKIAEIILRQHKNALNKTEITAFETIMKKKGKWTPELMGKALNLVHPSNVQKYDLNTTSHSIERFNPELFKKKSTKSNKPKIPK